MTLIHGRCQAPGRNKPRTSLPRCAYFLFFIIFLVSGSEASSGSGSPQSSTGLSNRRSWRKHVVTSVFASRRKSSEGKHTSDFCGLTSLLLPKKKEKEKKETKIENWTSLGMMRGRGSALGQDPKTSRGWFK